MQSTGKFLYYIHYPLYIKHREKTTILIPEKQRKLQLLINYCTLRSNLMLHLQRDITLAASSDNAIRPVV